MKTSIRSNFDMLRTHEAPLFLHVDPATALPVMPNARDVTNIGQWGTGNLEVTLASLADLEAAKPFIMAAYEGRAVGGI